MNTKLTMLNAMAGKQFPEALDRFAAWGLEVVDLKDHIFDKSIVELTESEADAAAEELRKRDLGVYCFSTGLFHDEIEKGEAYFREHHLARVAGIVKCAERLRPTMIRLLAARYTPEGDADSIHTIRRKAPWLIPLYREAIDIIHDAGFQATIENECHNCIFAEPSEIIAFFDKLDRPGKVHFTYDVQNLWQMGTYPSMRVYEALRPLIGYLHLKGGQHGEGGTALEWKSALEDASWPVADIVAQAVRDGVSPVICLNPSHGKIKDGYHYDHMTQRDLDFAKSIIGGA